MMTRPTPLRPRKTRGFTLVELMIAVTIGLLILAGMTSLFVRNSRSQAEIEKANRQIENGRYAIDALTGDLRNAGFYGEFDPTPLASPSALPDPCASSLAAIRAALPMHVQGYDSGALVPGCVQDQRAGTDVLVVRHTRTCVSGEGDCDEAGIAGPMFQASLCNNGSELDSGDLSNYYALDTDTSKLNRHRRDCTTIAPSRRYLTHIYFVANNDEPGDGIPTLKRAELRVVDGTLQFVRVPLVEGIDNLQLEYGIDTNNDGKADLFSSDPAAANGCSDATCAVTNWRNVVTVKLNLLARNTEASQGYQDTRKYVLGHKADGSDNQVGPANDHYKRHVFQSQVPLPNPVGRKQS
jgi:type IV pilus assembly protein PilW